MVGYLSSLEDRSGVLLPKQDIAIMRFLIVMKERLG